MVEGVVSPFEAMGSKLDPKGAQSVLSQPASERCQRVALAGRIGQIRVKPALRERRQQLLVRPDLSKERGAVLQCSPLPLEAGSKAGRAAQCPSGMEHLPGAVAAQDQPVLGMVDAIEPVVEPVVEARALDVELPQHAGTDQQ